MKLNFGQRFLGLVLCVFSLSACGSYRSSSLGLVQKAAIYDLNKQSWVGWSEAQEAFDDYDVIVVGEIHDQEKHHWIQARLIRELAARQQKIVVGLEHLRQNQQSVLDKFRRAQLDLPELREALYWDRSGWPAWEMFEPIFAEAFAADVRLIALDMEAEQLGELRRGQVGADFLKAWGLNKSLPLESQSKLEKTLVEGHDFEISKEMLYTMQLIQRARDATMAARLHRALRNSGAQLALMFCGAGHARKDWGVTKDFKMLEEDLKVLSIGLLPERARELIQTEKDEALFDWVWWTGP